MLAVSGLAAGTQLIVQSAGSDYALPIAMIGAAATVLAAAITVAISRRGDRKMASLEARRQRKTEVYDTFLEFWFRNLMSDQLGVPSPSTAETGKFFVEFTRDCIPWTSDGFVRAYSKFRMNFFSPPDTTQAVLDKKSMNTLYLFEGTLLEIPQGSGPFEPASEVLDAALTVGERHLQLSAAKEVRLGKTSRRHHGIELGRDAFFVEALPLKDPRRLPLS